jgi:alkaline phosphatase
MNPKYIFILLVLPIFLGCKPESREHATEIPSASIPPNIIFLIGDGMGLSQVSSVFYFPGDNATNFTRFKQLGLINTTPKKDKITDSAAGATAFANGKKSYNGAIGVGLDSMPLENITEILSKQGYATGVVSSSSITHATPACFYAHVPLRSMQKEIAAQLIDSDIDFFSGGGTQWFKENWNDLAANYVLDTQAIKMDQFDSSKKYGFLLAPDGMPKMSEGRCDFLPKSTEAALNYFDAVQKPFFLMVEGSQIDWGGHANDGQYIIDEMHDFDQVIGVALDYAEKQGNTLVIVTADHETGGFALSAKKSHDTDQSPYYEVMTTFSTGGHTSTLIPVFSKGPGEELMDGIYENNELFHKILEVSKMHQKD